MSSPASSMSFAERMESDPEFRDAYCNTTSVHLFADPEQASTDRILAKMQGASLAYMFEPDGFLPRPIIQTEFGQFVGEDEIYRALTRLVIPHVFDRS